MLKYRENCRLCHMGSPLGQQFVPRKVSFNSSFLSVLCPPLESLSVVVLVPTQLLYCSLMVSISCVFVLFSILVNTASILPSSVLLSSRLIVLRNFKRQFLFWAITFISFLAFLEIIIFLFSLFRRWIFRLDNFLSNLSYRPKMKNVVFCVVNSFRNVLQGFTGKRLARVFMLLGVKRWATGWRGVWFPGRFRVFIMVTSHWKVSSSVTDLL